jgi:hypothetical protein
LDVAAVASYLAGHLAVLLCGEVESALTGYFDELIDSVGCDESIKRLARSRKGAASSAKFSDLSGAIGRLGESAKEKFKTEVMSAVGEPGISRLGNVVSLRDDTAHNTPPLITLSEVELAAEVAKKVLQAARTAMTLN